MRVEGRRVACILCMKGDFFCKISKHFHHNKFILNNIKMSVEAKLYEVCRLVRYVKSIIQTQK